MKRHNLIDVTVPPGTCTVTAVQVGGSNVEVVDTFMYLNLIPNFTVQTEASMKLIDAFPSPEMYADVGQAHLAVQDLIEYHQTSALQCVYTSGIPVWSRNVIHNQSNRELMPLTNGVAAHPEHYLVRACDELRSP